VRKGFVLLIVIMIIGLMGAELFVMTGSTNKIGFQTNKALLEAVQQNMISSGIAWTKYNIENGNIKNTGKEIQLDTTDIGIRNAQLAVTTVKITHKQAEVTINTSCGFGGQKLKNSNKYVVLHR
jgi:hypothetical protein